MSCKVWVKLRGSGQRTDAFRVDIAPNAIIDDLKKAIKAEIGEKVEFIYSAEHSEDSKCKASALISSHDQAGSSEENPYYYTIATPAIPPQTVQFPAPPLTNQQAIANFLREVGYPAPSTFGNIFPQHIDEGKLKSIINFHRDPSDISSFPSSLVTPVISEYFDEVNSATLEEKDYLSTCKLCCLMMGVFKGGEAERSNAWGDFFREYFTGLSYQRIGFNPPAGKSTAQYNTDGSVTCYLPDLRFNVMLLNCDVKNELGDSQSSSLERCLWCHYCYLARTKEELLGRYCCPAILCSVVGPYISFSVGVYLGGDKYVCDPVTPFLQLMVLPHQQDMMVAVARALRATKNTLIKLQAEYQRKACASAEMDQLGYPYVHSFTDGNGNSYNFKYDEESPLTQSKKLVYGVKITKADEGARHAIGSGLVVKFTKTYCEDAHRLLSGQGLAPQLYHIQNLPGGWIMIVMENVVWPTLYDVGSLQTDVVRNIRSNLERALNLLQRESFVHGDLRTNNILVNPSGDIRIVDFDHSGRANQARYPPFLNKADINWAPGVECGGLLSPEHDLFFFNKIFVAPQLGEETKL